jgi:methyl-accepting chemotaxis protein
MSQWRLSTKILVPLLLVNAVMLAACLVVMLSAREQNVQTAGFGAAQAVANQVTTLRRFYTGEIVSRAKEAGMAVNYDFADRRDVLPLPATLVKALGAQIAEDHPGTVIRLYSRHPFPHRKATETYDAFEREALDALEKDPKTPFHRIETVDGRLSMRLATADVMGAGCVSCHNSHPESPKKDWKEGDVRGVVEVVMPVDATQAGLTASTWRVALAVVVGMLAVVAIVMWMLRRRVIAPLQVVRDAAQRIGAGDLTTQIPVASGDEVGKVAEAFNGAVLAMRDAVREVRRNAADLAIAGEELSSLSDQMTSSAEQTAVDAEAASGVADRVSQSVQAAASATEEMGSAILEIARSAGSAAEVATAAVQSAENSSATVQRLGNSSAEVGAVIKAITSIAEQTNLLALNATIEAARAGDAGKGFAVVAGEVKELAKQTAQATEDISARIEAIQTDARDAAGAIGEITSVVGRINEISSTIATAVEEQSATTAELSRGISDAATGTGQIAASVTGVAGAASSTKQAAAGTQDAAAKLARLAFELRRLVERFQVDATSPSDVAPASAAVATTSVAGLVAVAERGLGGDSSEPRKRTGAGARVSSGRPPSQLPIERSGNSFTTSERRDAHPRV